VSQSICCCNIAIQGFEVGAVPDDAILLNLAIECPPIFVVVGVKLPNGIMRIVSVVLLVGHNHCHPSLTQGNTNRPLAVT